jgi:hypothetical protein
MPMPWITLAITNLVVAVLIILFAELLTYFLHDTFAKSC